MKRYSTLLLFVAALIFSVAGTLRAQPAPSTPLSGEPTVGEDFYRNQYWAVGLNVGLLSGTGVAARASFPGGFTAQLATFVTSVPGSTYSVHFNVGGEIQYAFVRGNDGRLFSLLGMGYYHTGTKDTAGPSNAIANPFRIGAGLGYEWFTSRNVVISLSGAITYFPTTAEVWPLPQVGFYYYFR